MVSRGVLMIETIIYAILGVSGKEDPLEHPFVILIHIHDYECQQSNQTRKKLFRDKLNE